MANDPWVSWYLLASPHVQGSQVPQPHKKELKKIILSKENKTDVKNESWT